MSRKLITKSTAKRQASSRSLMKRFWTGTPAAFILGSAQRSRSALKTPPPIQPDSSWKSGRLFRSVAARAYATPATWSSRSSIEKGAPE